MKRRLIGLTFALSSLNSLAFITGQGDLMTSCKANFDQSSNVQCVSESLTTSTFNPTIPILEQDSMTSDEIEINLLTEYLDETSELETSKQVAVYLGITTQEVLNAVNYLYQYSKVSVENIKSYYEL